MSDAGVLICTIADERPQLLTGLRQYHDNLDDKKETESSHNVLYILEFSMIFRKSSGIGNSFEEPNIRAAGVSGGVNTKRRLRRRADDPKDLAPDLTSGMHLDPNLEHSPVNASVLIG